MYTIDEHMQFKIFRTCQKITIYNNIGLLQIIEIYKFSKKNVSLLFKKGVMFFFFFFKDF